MGEYAEDQAVLASQIQEFLNKHHPGEHLGSWSLVCSTVSMETLGKGSDSMIHLLSGNIYTCIGMLRSILSVLENGSSHVDDF